MQDSGGATTYTYSPRSELVGQTLPSGYKLTMAYDAVGNRTTLIDPDGGVFTYAYDANNRVTTVIDPDANITTLAYDAAGQRTTLQDASGATRKYAYDADGRLTTQIELNSSAAPIITIIDTYDPVGNRTGRNLNGTVVTWQYDSGYRLTTQIQSGYNATFVYDNAGNTLVKWQQGTSPMTFAYDGANRITTMLQGSVLTTYSYDATGNLTTINAGSGGITTYQYDNENRLVRQIVPGGDVSTYSYDGDGLRRSAYEPGTSGPKLFVWDGDDYLQERDLWGPVYRINSAGPTVEPSGFAPSSLQYLEDSGTISGVTVGGGGTYTGTTTAPIDTSGDPRVAPEVVYQSQRSTGGTINYQFSNLTVGAPYTIRLHFAEVYFGPGAPGGGGTGSRQFNVAINGTTILSNFDIYAEAGSFKALVKDFIATADGSGEITVLFTVGAANAPCCSGVEVADTATAAPIYRLYAGSSGAIDPVVFDPNENPNDLAYFSDTASLPSGVTVTSATTTFIAHDIDISQDTRCAPASVYQSQRLACTYTFADLSPGIEYTVRLYFAEMFYGPGSYFGTGGVGSRKFNVAINGTAVLTNFDIFATAGAANTGIVEDYTAVADGSGVITVVLTDGSADYATISGIEIRIGS